MSPQKENLSSDLESTLQLQSSFRPYNLLVNPGAPIKISLETSLPHPLLLNPLWSKIGMGMTGSTMKCEINFTSQIRQMTDVSVRLKKILGEHGMTPMDLLYNVGCYPEQVEDLEAIQVKVQNLCEA